MSKTYEALKRAEALRAQERAQQTFEEALDFVNRVGEVAEEQGHHPDVAFGWGYAEVTVFIHAIDGLTENDFILAAKVDRL